MHDIIDSAYKMLNYHKKTSSKTIFLLFSDNDLKM